MQPSRTTPATLAGDAQSRLGTAHARFARAALLIYLGSALVSVTLLFVSAITDRDHETREIVHQFDLQNQLRAQYVAEHMSLLESELERLARRDEVNLEDQDMGPEKSLLDFTHRQSAFFNAGVGLLGADGKILYSEPDNFLPAGGSVAKEPWFSSLGHLAAPQIVAAHPARTDDALLYVLAPVERGGRFEGALVGGLDLARESGMQLEYTSAEIDTLVCTHDGTVVYPADPPAYTQRADWKDFFTSAKGRPFLANGVVAGGQHVLAGVPINGTELLLLAEANPTLLFDAARSRMLTRIGVGLTLALAPLALLIFLLQRSLAVFERNESAAVRAERLRMLGEASNLIAHEVKNSLNNLRVGIDVLARRSSSDGNRVFDEIRREIQRLSDFTGELMTFSKGVAPRPIDLDLCSFVPEVAALSKEAASEVGASLDVVTPTAPIRVSADPALVHVVVGNLVSNAVDAVAARKDGGGKVEVRIDTTNGSARVRVVDNGPGVALTVKDHLFEPFVTGKPSGVGIGLALSRKIARAHGGDLVLDSTSPDPGTSFSLVLPMQKEQAT